jgi:hypothetical protein
MIAASGREKLTAEEPDYLRLLAIPLLPPLIVLIGAYVSAGAFRWVAEGFAGRQSNR